MGIHTLSDSIGASGGPIEWTCSKGTVYQISLLTLEKQSKFERAMERKCIDSLKGLRTLLEKDEYSDALAAALGSIKDGDYVFGGDHSSDCLKTLWGISTLISILMGVSPEEASVIINSNEDIGPLIEVVIERSFPVAMGKSRAAKVKEK